MLVFHMGITPWVNELTLMGVPGRGRRVRPKSGIVTGVAWLRGAQVAVAGVNAIGGSGRRPHRALVGLDHDAVLAGVPGAFSARVDPVHICGVWCSGLPI